MFLTGRAWNLLLHHSAGFGAMVAFLASGEASYISGGVFAPDSIAYFTKIGIFSVC